MAIEMGKTLAFTAVSGMVAGLTGCGSSNLPEPEAGAPSGEPADAAPAASAKECCAGKNECKGKGGCKTDTHGCAGQNECKGKGGCKPAECGGMAH
ncbi:uncharacterized protein SOCEGT47_031270 [Sorangium cellulosum]|uniref:Uncharacterized protein n=1 Tax=Sorangium cellulosum TaxID=56 RepID=A0A4P2Q197_SORCE|nr:hypothetical protein [Sorangium cellulosum]AUX22623.1 uncharacterized protein SOCEGT47_031270 [Sorangium cellulosum]